MSQKQQTLVLSSCLQKHTSEGNPVHQLIVANHSTNITQNCEHSTLFFLSDMWENKKSKKIEHYKKFWNQYWQVKSACNCCLGL